MNDDKAGGPAPNGEQPLHEIGNGSGPYSSDPYGGAGASGSADLPATASTAVVVASPGGIRKPPPPPPPPPADEEDGMLRMSFMDHLSELRSRIIKVLWGFGVAFILSLVFADRLWAIIREPAVEALKFLHVNPPKLAQISPMEGFSIIWMKLPFLCSIFLSSPWTVYQIWSFISPGLYKRERRMAAPFILSTAGLFIGGGLFAYFLAFRYGLTFLLGIGVMNDVQPVVTITEYFDLFVNVTLGVGIVFEMPVIIFMLTLLRLASPRFLIRHSRYAILGIVIIAAIVTPTPDVFNLMLFAVPMVVLYFVGVFAGFLIVLKREGKGFPWRLTILIALGIVMILALLFVLLVARFHVYGLKLINHWPYFTR